MSDVTKRVLLGIFFSVLSCASIWGQASTGQITGTVRDASGLAVPAAEVKATQTATGVSRTVTTGAQGDYTLANLPIGPYQIEVSKEGFNKYVQSGIILNVDSNPTVDVALKVGNVSEQVTVSEDALQVETHSTGIGNVVTNQQVAEMPLNGRDPHELIFLSGMSTFPGNGNINTVRNYPTVIVSVAGGQGNSVTYLLDGAVHQDPYNNLSLPLPFPDALQEFKVESSSLTAQYGFHAGAAVNAVTKSGNNEYHGDLFEFLRNGDMNARDFFAPVHDSLKRNQFGGVVGGPVLPRFRNKLFFFGGYQRTSNRSDPQQGIAFVPTPAALTGNFSSLESPQCNNGVQKNLLASAGFTNNTIAPSLLNQVAINITKTFPVPTGPCGQVQYGLLNDSDEDLYVGKVDYQISDKNSFFSRFTVAHLNEANSYNGNDGLTVNSYGVNDLDMTIAFGDTYLFTSNVVNSLRVAASRTNIVKVPDNYGDWSNFGAAVTNIPGTTIAIVAGSDFNIGGGPASPGQSHNGPNPSVSDDVSWVKGTHQFTFGGSLYFQQMNYYSGVNANGTATFTGAISGNILSDFLLGAPSGGFTQGTLFGFYDRQWYAALYAQDSWKVTPRLTVNVGVRWEPYTSVYNAYGQIVNFNPALFAAGVKSSVYTNAPAGLNFPGDSSYPCGNSFNCDDWHKFFPRAGLAWDPKGDGKMTIRAAYGMYGDRAHMFYSNQNEFSPPFGGNLSAPGVGLTTTLSNPWANEAGGNPIPNLLANTGIGHSPADAPFLQGGTIVSLDTNNYKPMYVNQWNLSVQRQIGQDWLVSANYLGNSTIHMITSESVNPAVYLGLGTCTLPNGITYNPCSTTANQAYRRVLSLENYTQGQYLDGGIGQQDSGGTGSYEGLYLSATKRLSKNTSLLVNYTWSHCISDVYDQQTTAAGVTPNIPISANPLVATPYPSGDRSFYKSNCIGSDLRQSLGLSAVATSPKFSNTWARRLASNWQVAPIIYLRSAQFFTVTSGQDVALTAAPGQNPNYLGGSPYAINQGPNQWLNPAAFVNPAAGTYGNLGENNLRGPGEVQVNVALSRTFTIREKKTLQIRMEAFNILNHPNFATPNASALSANNATAPLNSASFGQIITDISGNNGLAGGDPRILQAALKFVF
jgi:Carboxypeptidase regulatory-like domain/TonB dependent receptor